jgi:hypothetical protein
MRCQVFQARIHEFLDGELPPREMSWMEEHRLRCEPCRRDYEELVLIRQGIGTRATMPLAAVEQVRRRLDRHLQGGDGLREAADWLRTYWRDLDRRFVWSKVSAVPVTLCLFALLLVYFSPARLERLDMLAFSSHPADRQGVPFVRSVRMRQTREDIQILLDVAWRLPFEDSLSVVAEIRPDGIVEIDSVLEYPRSRALLTAVDGALRRSRFDRGPVTGNRLVIFSFQKIDVYDETNGHGQKGT